MHVPHLAIFPAANRFFVSQSCFNLYFISYWILTILALQAALLPHVQMLISSKVPELATIAHKAVEEDHMAVVVRGHRCVTFPQVHLDMPAD
jgi:hypothetical protein